MPAARCTVCGVNFPLDRAGDECPICQVDTLDAIQNDVPDDEEDLRRLVNRASFDRYLEETGRA